MKRKVANLYDYRQRHKEKEAQRIKALANGKEAMYGYFKGFNSVIPETEYNDVPLDIYKNKYRLEVTYQQANEAITDGALNINMIIKHKNKFYLTYKNALKLNNYALIKDVNGTYLIYFNNMFYKIPFLLIFNIIIILLFAMGLRWCFLFVSIPLMLCNVWHFSKDTS